MLNIQAIGIGALIGFRRRDLPEQARII